MSSALNPAKRLKTKINVNFAGNQREQKQSTIKSLTPIKLSGCKLTENFFYAYSYLILSISEGRQISFRIQKSNFLKIQNRQY